MTSTVLFLFLVWSFLFFTYFLGLGCSGSSAKEINFYQLDYESKTLWIFFSYLSLQTFTPCELQFQRARTMNTFLFFGGGILGAAMKLLCGINVLPLILKVCPFGSKVHFLLFSFLIAECSCKFFGFKKWGDNLCFL